MKNIYLRMYMIVMLKHRAKPLSQSGGVKQTTGHEVMLLNLVLNMAMFSLRLTS